MPVGGATVEFELTVERRVEGGCPQVEAIAEEVEVATSEKFIGVSAPLHFALCSVVARCKYGDNRRGVLVKGGINLPIGDEGRERESSS